MPLLGEAAAWPPDPDPEDDHDEDGGIVLGLLWPIIVLSFLLSNLCVTMLILQQQWWSLLKRLVKHLTSAPSGSPNWCSNRKLHLKLSTFNFWMSLQVETSSDGSKLNCAFSSIVTGRDAKRDRYGQYICVFLAVLSRQCAFRTFVIITVRNAQPWWRSTTNTLEGH